MKLVVFTIVRNGMPWICCHYPMLRQLQAPWEWVVIEGTALAENCTSWCNTMRPGLSDDGTTEYLDSLAFDPRVIVRRNEAWHGKIAMVNEALRFQNDPCVLVEVDADELWKPEQLETIHRTFRMGSSCNCMRFTCRYFLGYDIAITQRGMFGNRAGEWLRAWHYEPGMRFKSHEPPIIDGFQEKCMENKATEKMGLIFDHMAYATEPQIKFKVDYYGSPQNPLGKLYANAVDGWHRLQQNTKWPAKVRDFLPFVNDDSVCERVKT